MTNQQIIQEFREKFTEEGRGKIWKNEPIFCEDIESFLLSALQEQKKKIIKSIQGQPCSEEHCILKQRIIKILETN